MPPLQRLHEFARGDRRDIAFALQLLLFRVHRIGHVDREHEFGVDRRWRSATCRRAAAAERGAAMPVPGRERRAPARTSDDRGQRETESASRASSLRDSDMVPRGMRGRKVRIWARRNADSMRSSHGSASQPQRLLGRRVFQLQRIGDGAVRDLPSCTLRPLRRCGSSPSARRTPSSASASTNGSVHVVEREGRGARDRARHVGHAIVHHLVDHIGRIANAWSAARSPRSRPGRSPRRR